MLIADGKSNTVPATVFNSTRIPLAVSTSRAAHIAFELSLGDIFGAASHAVAADLEI
ncbi:hypothetical protein [Nocardia bovistercoris]|uniref:hypothetical protein n=1 Tax=Nocardia bovistercoris TaxID=2785916 RepID=UPI001E5A534A|nr:hypothetical protein [Nocardia bovistercoris]